MLKPDEMVKLLTEALSRNVGITEIEVDGQVVKYDRDSLMKELAYWQAKAARESGRRPLFRGIDVGSAW